MMLEYFETIFINSDNLLHIYTGFGRAAGLSQLRFDFRARIAYNLTALLYRQSVTRNLVKETAFHGSKVQISYESIAMR